MSVGQMVGLESSMTAEEMLARIRMLDEEADWWGKEPSEYRYKNNRDERERLVKRLKDQGIELGEAA